MELFSPPRQMSNRIDSRSNNSILRTPSEYVGRTDDGSDFKSIEEAFNSLIRKSPAARKAAQALKSPNPFLKSPSSRLLARTSPFHFASPAPEGQLKSFNFRVESSDVDPSSTNNSISNLLRPPSSSHGLPSKPHWSNISSFSALDAGSGSLPVSRPPTSAGGALALPPSSNHHSSSSSSSFRRRAFASAAATAFESSSSSSFPSSGSSFNSTLRAMPPPRSSNQFRNDRVGTPQVSSGLNPTQSRASQILLPESLFAVTEEDEEADEESTEDLQSPSKLIQSVLAPHVHSFSFTSPARPQASPKSSTSSTRQNPPTPPAPTLPQISSFDDRVITRESFSRSDPLPFARRRQQLLESISPDSFNGNLNPYQTFAPAPPPSRSGVTNTDQFNNIRRSRLSREPSIESVVSDAPTEDSFAPDPDFPKGFNIDQSIERIPRFSQHGRRRRSADSSTEFANYISIAGARNGSHQSFAAESISDQESDKLKPAPSSSSSVLQAPSSVELNESDAAAMFAEKLRRRREERIAREQLEARMAQKSDRTKKSMLPSPAHRNISNNLHNGDSLFSNESAPLPSNNLSVPTSSISPALSPSKRGSGEASFFRPFTSSSSSNSNATSKSSSSTRMNAIPISTSTSSSLPSARRQQHNLQQEPSGLGYYEDSISALTSARGRPTTSSGHSISSNSSSASSSHSSVRPPTRGN